jgi:hypothetical protein
LDEKRTIVGVNTFLFLSDKINVVHIYIYTALRVYQFYIDFPQNCYINALTVSLYQVGHTRIFHVYFSSLFTSHPNIHAI